MTSTNVDAVILILQALQHGIGSIFLTLRTNGGEGLRSGRNSFCSIKGGNTNLSVVCLCQGHTFLTVRCHDLDKLMRSLKENSNPIHIFRLSLWIRRILGEVYLRQLNTTCAKYNLVRPHMPPVRECLTVCISSRLTSTLGQVIRLDLASTLGQGLSCTTSHLSHCLGSQQHGPCIVIPSHVSGQLGHLGLLEHVYWNQPMC